MSYSLTSLNEKTGDDARNGAFSFPLNSISDGGREFHSSPCIFQVNYLCRYDVFLSFRGKDTRNTFTDHLYAALLRKGVNTFRDDRKLQRGESITAGISKAIQQSKSSLIVFSRNYAFSSWCLEELVQIVECKHKRGHRIFPIFYDVDPSVVRKQTGSFRKAFDKHRWTFWKDKTKLQHWRSALVEVANISGWNVKDRLESEVIEEVAVKISVQLSPTASNYNCVSELAKIDHCLETLSSYVASTNFLGSKYGCKDEAGCSGARGSTSLILQQAAYSWAGPGDRASLQHQSTCSLEQVQRYPRIEEHVKRVTGSLLKEYPLQSLLKATDHFSHRLIIGRGGFSLVYHGTLEDNSVVAVKRIRKDELFLQELEILSRLHHKNIVWFSGFHVDDFERILVYEYLPNCSLYNHLFMFPESPLSSSWAARVKAALDIARGLEYLHEYARPPIIHRDVKSSNVLLDSKWTAKVADFGLSLVVPEGDEVDCDEVCGTPGYMDPEYYRVKKVTKKSDVYGLGVVLLELLTGHRACSFDEPRWSLVDFAVPCIRQGRTQDILDQRVAVPTSLEMPVLHSVADLAAECVNPESRFRPSMAEIAVCLLKVSAQLM